MSKMAMEFFLSESLHIMLFTRWTSQVNKREYMALAIASLKSQQQKILKIFKLNSKKLSQLIQIETYTFFLL